jgi:sulfite oxidase
VAIGLLRSLVETGSVELEVQHVVSKVTRTLPRLADGTHDLAALARSVSVPGLRDRIAAYAGASRLSPRAFDRNGELQMAESSLAAHTASGTPVDDVFLVHHYTRPAPSGADKLEIVGRDGNVTTVSHDQIRALPRREVTAVLECAGNGRGHLEARAPGNQFGLGLFAQNRWAGACLADVLALAGIRESDVTQLVVEGADEGLTAPENTYDRFAKGLPGQKALHPDTLLAWQLEEGAVPHAHGGPLRLVVPGWYGIWWVKWPSRMRVADEEFTGFWQHQRYTYQDADGTVLSLVAQHRPRAVLCSPAAGQRASDPVMDILAWAGERRVASVEYTVDDGATWLPAERVAEHGRWGWTQWTGRLPEGLPRGLCRVAVRATDDAGRTQDWQPEPNRLGYGNNSIHTVQVELVAAAPATKRGKS